MKAVLILLVILISGACKSNMEDNYLWMEDVEGERALSWVKDQNRITFENFTSSGQFENVRDEMVSLMDDKERIPYPRIRGKYVYNFWSDATNMKGLWRRTSLDSYMTGKPDWNVLLDLDKLSREEGQSWVFKGVTMLGSDLNRCLVKLSPGGSDASETREFDLETRQFVKGGFYIPVCKGGASWLDKDTLMVQTTLNKEDCTSSGYPRTIRIWPRGTELSEAKEIYAGKETDVSSGAYKLDEEEELVVIYRSITFYEREVSLWEDGKVHQLPIPKDSSIKGYFKGDLFVELKSAWKGYKSGALISINFKNLLKDEYEIHSVYTPKANTSLEDFSYTKNHVYLTVIEDVKSKLFKVKKKGSHWQKSLLDLPENGRISVVSTSDKSDELFINFQSFLKPSTLFIYDGSNLKEYQGIKDKFDSSVYVTEQFFAQSPDGTRVPYFMVRRKDLKLDGNNPVLLNAYGGFQISLKPYYSSFLGRFWLDRGGVFVMANIRGGGEYGPEWHKSAIKFNKHKSYEDFIAVSEDLIKRKVTSKDRLAIKGGSNGGLLMGVMLTRRPDLFKAVVCQVPLLDMMRYHKLLAGASWMGEYGNPENEAEKEYILSYSPFHNLSEDKEYPEVLFTTSTKDDRVHPGHARKMAKKMIDHGHKIHYYENIEGGHGGAADLKQRATLSALEYMYLYKKLGMTSSE